MTRAAQECPVFYFEEPLFVSESETAWEPALQSASPAPGVEVLTPMLPRGLSGEQVVEAQRVLLDAWLIKHEIASYAAWYYTPMALGFTQHLEPAVTVYDCMDELSAFQGAPAGLLRLEEQLFARADVVFAGGRSLFEAKRLRHGNAHLFASSVDRQHYAASREPQADPGDQRGIAHPRIGFFGVLDERLDRELLRAMAHDEPAWQFILIGPIVKIDEGDLPRAANLHYLGQKQYQQLPVYLGNWDVAMLPFAQNESTRFISPTKTLEYLAAGKPVVSTPVRDVVEPYGSMGLARIAGDAAEFCEAIRASLAERSEVWLTQVDAYLQGSSWDGTFARMWAEVQTAQLEKSKRERGAHV